MQRAKDFHESLQPVIKGEISERIPEKRRKTVNRVNRQEGEVDRQVEFARSLFAYLDELGPDYYLLTHNGNEDCGSVGSCNPHRIEILLEQLRSGRRLVGFVWQSPRLGRLMSMSLRCVQDQAAVDFVHATAKEMYLYRKVDEKIERELELLYKSSPHGVGLGRAA